MSSSVPRIDPGFAAVLDSYTVEPPSANFADKIVAATSGAQIITSGSSQPPRDRRGPWTRRAIAGGLALVLGTTAVAATLLQRAGIRLPEMVAMLSPAVSFTSPPPLSAKHHAKLLSAPALIVQSDDALNDPQNPATEQLVRELPRAAMVRERLAELPPVVRRMVVRRAVRRAIAIRIAERPVTVGAGVAPGSPASIVADRSSLISRPEVRAALIERIRAAREARTPVRSPIGVPIPPAATADTIRTGASAPITSLVANSPPAHRLAEDRMTRLRQLGDLRRMRVFRQELRRQRRR